MTSGGGLKLGTMKKPLLLIGLLSCIVIALVLLRISLVDSISTSGIKLVDLQNQINEYKNENELLQVQYLQAASYTNIFAKASKLGYVHVETQVDLTTPEPLALR
jgi:cell division protein FtsL